MISPNEAKNLGGTKQRGILEIVADVDDGINRVHGWYPWEEAILPYDLPLHTRNRIANMYLRVGWKFVYHHTATENLTRPGLTIFRLSMKPLSPELVRRMYAVQNDERGENE